MIVGRKKRTSLDKQQFTRIFSTHKCFDYKFEIYFSFNSGAMSIEGKQNFKVKRKIFHRTYVYIIIGLKSDLYIFAVFLVLLQYIMHTFHTIVTSFSFSIYILGLLYNLGFHSIIVKVCPPVCVFLCVRANIFIQIHSYLADPGRPGTALQAPS